MVLEVLRDRTVREVQQPQSIPFGHEGPPAQWLREVLLVPLRLEGPPVQLLREALLVPGCLAAQLVPAARRFLPSRQTHLNSALMR